MRNIFFSYSTKDSKDATKIVEGLKLAGHKVWFAPGNLIGGDFYALEIEEAIPKCDIFVLLASKHSVGNKALKVEGSEEVGNEISLAKKYGLKIIPLPLDASLKSAASGGNEYQLINQQYIEISAALVSGDFSPVINEIIAAADKINTKSQDEEYIEQAEMNLILGHPELSIRVMGEHAFRLENTPRVDFIKVLSSLMRKGIKNLNISEADKLTSEFERLRSTNMASAATYMLAILKTFCYEKKAFKNSIEDFLTLKASVNECKPIEVKYRFVADELLPTDSQFAVDWLK